MSQRALAIAIAGLALAGLAVSGYLAFVYAEGVTPFCLAGGGCATVQTSEYASFAGVSVPVLGIAGYAAVLGSLLIRGDAGRMATAGLGLVGFGFSAYLTYLELFVIEAICTWCVVSALLMTGIAALAAIRLLRAPLQVSDGAPGSA